MRHLKKYESYKDNDFADILKMEYGQSDREHDRFTERELDIINKLLLKPVILRYNKKHTPIYLHKANSLNNKGFQYYYEQPGIQLYITKYKDEFYKISYRKKNSKGYWKDYDYACDQLSEVVDFIKDEWPNNLNESVNPDRISDGTFRIYSDRLEFNKGGYTDRKNLNLFYISDISTDESLYDDLGFHICIKFYNPNFTIFGTKILSIGIIIAHGNVVSFWGEINPPIVERQIVDVMFSEESFKNLMEFIKDDSPEYYNRLGEITYSELEGCRRRLLRRI